MRARFWILLKAVSAAILAVFVFVAVLPGLSKKDLSISLKERRIKDLSSRGLVLAFHVSVRNASGVAVFLSRYTTRVTVNQKEYLKMPVVLDDPIRIGAGEEVVVALPLKVTYDLLVQSVGPVGEKASCDAVGEFVFRDEKGKEERLPFAFSGEFPIFKDPGVEYLPLKVNDLTVGGGDMVFGVRLTNPNGWDLVVDTIRYDLRFGDTSVLAGEIPGDKSVPARGEKVLTLPFLLDFFEIGKNIHDMLQSPPVACRFSGVVVIRSAWGPLTVSFDKTGPLAVSRAAE
jgi:LEA14-like dessication related protein